MISLKQCQLKSKIIFLALLPLFALLIAGISILISNYLTMNEMGKVKQIQSLAGKVHLLIDGLEAEEEQSVAFLMLQKTDFNRGSLQDTRETVDQRVSDLKNYLAANDYVAFGKLMLSIKKLVENVEKLLDQRILIDEKKISISNLGSYFAALEEMGSEVFGDVAIKISNVSVLRNSFLIYSYLQYKIVHMELRQIIHSALLLGQLSQEEYSILLTDIGREKVYREFILRLGDADQDQLYQNFRKNSDVIQFDTLRDSFLAKGLKGPYGVSPEEWQRISSIKANLLNGIEDKLINENNQLVQNLLSNARWAFYLTFGLLLLVIIVTLLFMRSIYGSLKELTLRFQEQVSSLAAAVSQILSSVTETSTATVETAAAVSETTATAEELKQTAQVAADKAQEVSAVSKEGLEVLKSSEYSLASTMEGMSRIQEAMRTISDSIVKLSSHSQTIGEIIETVNDLAGQSNLLAVNASIEAAKAGDRGFAVVAQEVRSLAEQSKQATKHIRTILSDIQNATSAAVMATEQGSKAVDNGAVKTAETNQSIHNLSGEVSKMAQSAVQISSSSQQQLIGVGQITDAMMQIKSAADLQSDRMKEIENAIHDLHSVGQSLKELVLTKL